MGCAGFALLLVVVAQVHKNFLVPVVSVKTKLRCRRLAVDADICSFPGCVPEVRYSRAVFTGGGGSCYRNGEIRINTTRIILYIFPLQNPGVFSRNFKSHFLQITVTQTQTIRVPVTSDVWVSTVTQQTVTATQLTTLWSFAPTHPDTVTSVITITNTPVIAYGSSRGLTFPVV